MNKTKKLTTGAMLLAIVGAIMMIDRQLSYALETIILLLIPVVIIVYSTMYELKDGAILCVCLLLITIVIGNPAFGYFYMPLSLIVGLGYSFGIKKNLTSKELLIVSIILFLIGEIVVTFMAMPLFGFDVATNIDELKVIFDQMFNSNNMVNSFDSFEKVGLSIDNVLLLSFVLSIFFTGIMEGIFVHILTIFIMHRLKIKEIIKGNAFSFDLKPLAAYICIFMLFGMFFVGMIPSEQLKLLVLALSLSAFMVLMFYGYLFTVSFVKIRFNGSRTSVILLVVAIILFFPTSLFILAILGFLYGAGPLRKYLIRGN